MEPSQDRGGEESKTNFFQINPFPLSPGPQSPSPSSFTLSLSSLFLPSLTAAALLFLGLEGPLGLFSRPARNPKTTLAGPI